MTGARLRAVAAPFVVLVMTPFVEQIDADVESAVLLVIALMFVNPTQIVAQVREAPAE
ncbi:hypothetical protein ACQEU6_46150 [Spirillospora sp. CA-108201]